jgi:hypothetical protein
MTKKTPVKYVLVYYGGGMPEGASARARVMKQWANWYAKLGAAIVDGGHAFSGAVSKIKPGGPDRTARIRLQHRRGALPRGSHEDGKGLSDP